MAVGNVGGSGSSLQTGLQGVQNGIRKVEQAADEIASSGTTESLDPADLATSLVDLKQGELQVKASAEVIETEDEVLGTLLDTLA